MKVSALLSGGTGGGAKLPTSHTLHYWPLPLFSCLPPPVGYFWETLGGDEPPGSQNPDLILDKNFHYPNPFSDLKLLTFVQNPFQIRILSCFLVHLELK